MSASGNGQHHVSPLRTWKFWILWVVLGGASYLAGHSPLGRRLSLVMLDWASERSATAAKGAQRTALVLLRPEDRAALFGGRRPLDPSDLFRVISAIDAAGPAAIGVDLFTHPASYGGAALPQLTSRVIWSFSADPVTRDFLPPLGGREPAPEYQGLVLALPDTSDFRLRAYRSFFARGNAAPVESFAHAVARAYCDDQRKGTNAVSAPGCTGIGKRRTEEGIFLNRRQEDENRVFVQPLLHAFESREEDGAAWARVVELLRGRVVLLGVVGTTDAQEAADGEQAGVVILARMVESELDMSFIRLLPGWADILIDGALGLIIGLVFAYTSWRLATGFLGLLVAVTLYLSSQPALLSGIWINGVSLLIGYWIEHFSEGFLGHSSGEATSAS